MKKLLLLYQSTSIKNMTGHKHTEEMPTQTERLPLGFGQVSRSFWMVWKRKSKDRNAAFQLIIALSLPIQCAISFVFQF